MKQILKVLPIPQKPNFRNSAAWLVGGLTLWTASIAYYSRVAKAQEPFSCDGLFFLSQGINPPNTVPTTLNVVNTGSVPFNLTARGGDEDRNNATGFRFDVNGSFIYGINPDRIGQSVTNKAQVVYKIDRNGKLFPISNGSIAQGASTLAQEARFIAGDIGINGNYYVYGGNGVLLEIDVSGPEAMLVLPEKRLQDPANGNSPPDIADFALNPLDGNFYAFTRNGNRLVFFNPNDPSPISIQDLPGVSGLPTIFPAPPGTARDNVGAAFFDGAGNLFIYKNGNIQPPGELYRINVGVEGNRPSAITSVRLSEAEAVSNNDGSACPFAPKLEKSVSTNQVVAGGTIDYFYTITNPNAVAITQQFPPLTFSDNLTNGRTFVSAEIVQPVTGDLSTFSGGNLSISDGQSLTISNLGLPSTNAIASPPQVGKIVIKATVRVALNASAGTVFNQATLNGLPGPFPPSIPSDFPGAGALPDPSPLVILPPPVPAGTKSVELAIDADNTSSVTPGDTIEYAVSYFNTSSSTDVTDFAVTDTIDSNLTFVPGSYNFQVASGSPAVSENTAFDGTSDNRLTLPGGILTPGSQITVSYRATINANVTPGTVIDNQASATSTASPPGSPDTIITPSVTDAVGDSSQIPQVLDDGQEGGNSPGNTGDDEPTRLVVADPTADGNLVLVKRITNVIRNGVPLAGINFSNFIDDEADINDNFPGWSALSPVGVLSLGTDNALSSGDTVEYTVYFLSNGRKPVEDLKICDAIPERTDYVANSLISFQNLGNPSFFNELDSSLPVPPCPNSNNPDGAVSLDLSPSFSNTSPDNVGFVRFRVEIN
ncbi:MAG: isopeptide-forming domain-containing fimbrial protein [Spirulinaceae cyanobacterium]